MPLSPRQHTLDTLPPNEAAQEIIDWLVAQDRNQFATPTGESRHYHLIPDIRESRGTVTLALSMRTGPQPADHAQNSFFSNRIAIRFPVAKLEQYVDALVEETDFRNVFNDDFAEKIRHQASRHLARTTAEYDPLLNDPDASERKMQHPPTPGAPAAIPVARQEETVKTAVRFLFDFDTKHGHPKRVYRLTCSIEPSRTALPQQDPQLCLRLLLETPRVDSPQGILPLYIKTKLIHCRLSALDQCLQHITEEAQQNGHFSNDIAAGFQEKKQLLLERLSGNANAPVPRTRMLEADMEKPGGYILPERKPAAAAFSHASTNDPYQTFRELLSQPHCTLVSLSVEKKPYAPEDGDLKLKIDVNGTSHILAIPFSGMFVSSTHLRAGTKVKPEIAEKLAAILHDIPGLSVPQTLSTRTFVQNALDDPSGASGRRFTHR